MLQWNGNEFVSARKWETVALWNGKEFASVPLDKAGKFAGATADCSMATAEKVVLAAASPAWLRDSQYPIVKLICRSITGMPGTELGVVVANAPSVGGTPLLLFRKLPVGPMAAA